MKLFGITKTGYTAGIYGNSGEYFTCIYVDHNGMNAFKFHGQYGAEERVARLMRDRGYKEAYIQSDYGQLRRKDIMKNNYSEHTIASRLDELLTIGYISYDEQ